MIPLEGTKVRLRDWREPDLAPYAYWLRPGHEWRKFDAPYYSVPTETQIEEMVAEKRQEISGDTPPRPRTSLVIADKATDELMGVVTWSWESKETLWPTVGIAIFDPGCWSRGIGYEALGMWSSYLFRELPIARLDLRTWSGNGRMMRLAEKLGYQLEARFRKARIVEGHYYDSLGYGVLREEWANLYPDGFAASLRRVE